MDGVLRITAIRVTYRFKIPSGTGDEAQQALAVYADGCPAYQTVKDCIACSWSAEMEEE